MAVENKLPHKCQQLYCSCFRNRTVKRDDSRSANAYEGDMQQNILQLRTVPIVPENYAIIDGRGTNF